MGLVRALAVLAVLAPAGAAAQAPSWTVLEESTVGFTASQSGAPVDGLFQNFKAEVLFDEKMLDQSRLDVTVEIASVYSQSKDRDDTIKSASLFDAAKWPTGRFVADKIVKTGDTKFEAHGKLTLRDVTKDVVLPFQVQIEQDPVAPDRLRANAWGEVEVKRLDYGIGQGLWKDTSVVANNVLIRLEITAWRKKE